MKKQSVYRQILIRTGIGLAIVLPISFLYDLSLTSLNAYQIEVQTKALLTIMLPILLFLAFLIWINMRPLTKAVDVILAGGNISEKAAIGAEKRALIMPYIVGFHILIFFFGAASIVNWTLLKKAGLAYDSFLYLVISSITSAIMMGIAGSFLVRKPLREALTLVMENSPASMVKPPFFVPISVKLMATFVIVIALFLTFSGLLSSVITKRIADRERITAQKHDIEALTVMLEGRNLDLNELNALLARIGFSGNRYYLFDKDFKPLSERIDEATAGNLKGISETPQNQSYNKTDAGLSWTWAATRDEAYKIVSRRELIKAAAVGEEIKKYYMVAALVALLVGVSVGMLMARDISSTLKELSARAVATVEGNAGSGLISGSEDETGILARAFNKMSRVLLSQLTNELSKSRGMMDSIHDAVETLAPMSREMVVIAGRQADGSVRQASSAEEAAATSQEIAQVSSQIAEHSTNVTNSAESSLELTQQGQQHIEILRDTGEDITRKMKNIAESVSNLGIQSKEIGEIIAIIDDISDHITLLAFNAAIEAGAAGVQGSRFGVVAREVQRLANNTAASTKRIKEIVSRMQGSLGSSVSLAGEGDKAVKNARSAIEGMANLFASIFRAAADATLQMKEINLMTTQQATASQQMANTMSEVQETARQSSAAAEELTVSVEKLNKIVIQLETHIESES